MPREISASDFERRIEKIRQFSAARITAALLATEGRRDIERLLAIGEVCPYSGMRECQAIWIEEFQRLWPLRNELRQAERAA